MIELYCGSVIILGKSNVGKSTLLNTLMGEKVSIMSNKCNTTQKDIFGIYTYMNNQIIFIDTPGYKNFNDKNFINNSINKIVNSDIVLYVIDPFYWNFHDDEFIKKLKELKSIVILVINKIDKLNYKLFLLYRIKHIVMKYNIYDVIPVSAVKHLYIDILRKKIISYLPIMNHLYPVYKKVIIDIKFYLIEIIREKLINILKQELSYTLKININNLFIKKNIVVIDAYILSYKSSQKGILLGNKNNIIKIVSKKSRISMENYLEKKVFLTLWIKMIIK
ncbi:MAG: GTPase Era [Candidatus Azosocius agrarius]|nr:MAG: GTPase Era [Gammaproteobacteria bacterium]